MTHSVFKEGSLVRVMNNKEMEELGYEGVIGRIIGVSTLIKRTDDKTRNNKTCHYLDTVDKGMILVPVEHLLSVEK